MPYLPVARNLSSHRLQRRVGVPGIEFRDHRRALVGALAARTPHAACGPRNGRGNAASKAVVTANLDSVYSTGRRVPLGLARNSMSRAAYRSINTGQGSNGYEGAPVACR